MAKIKFAYPGGEGEPTVIETIEVRPWALAGTARQQFSLHSGMNFNAETNMWVEIIYTVQGVQIFYTRNFLHLFSEPGSPAENEERLDRFVRGDYDGFGFGDMFPETSVLLKREKYTYDEKAHESYSLKISADVAVVFNPDSGPGMRSIDIKLNSIPLETGALFMRDLIAEMFSASQGRHPDPARLPAHGSDWQFARQLNLNAYNIISQDYNEVYFSVESFVELFETWLKDIPKGGRIIDVGCGHGDPVIGKLLERGYRVTGIDPSPGMLRRAREQFPNVEFFNRAVTEIEQESVFDAACSLSSMLYLDPIDLLNGIQRLHRSLKPGAPLFLYGYDLHPSWRGTPFHVTLKHWMWAWTYGMDAATRALEEHGRFEVIRAENITTEKEQQERLEEWKKNQQEDHDKLIKRLSESVQHLAVRLPPLPDLDTPPDSLPYRYVIIARRK